MPVKPFTKKEQQFIVDNRLIFSSGQLAQKLKCSKTKVQRFINKSGLQPPAEVIELFRRNGLSGKTICTPAQDKIIKRDYLKTPIKRLAANLGISQTCLRNRLKQLNLVIPADLATARKKANQIKPGNTPANKGKKMPADLYEKASATMFKKGHLPHNAVGFKDGDIRTRTDNKTGIVYKYIRLALGKWYPLHQHEWEQVNGELPKKHCLWFKDRNSLNCSLDNLELITRVENMKRNSCSLNLTDTYVANTLCRKKGGLGLYDTEARELILQNKPLLDLKRQQLLLNRTINGCKKINNPS
jgi:hypothetical protein